MHIVTVAVGEKATVIKEIAVNEENDIIESQVNDSVPTSTPRTSATTTDIETGTTGEVLGIQTENNSKNRNNLVITLVITLVSILGITYIIKRKQKV